MNLRDRHTFGDLVWPFPLDRPGDDRQPSSDQESKHQILIQAIGTIHPLWSDYSEQDSRGEKGSLALSSCTGRRPEAYIVWTGHQVLLTRLTQVRNSRLLPIDDSDTDQTT